MEAWHHIRQKYIISGPTERGQVRTGKVTCEPVNRPADFTLRSGNGRRYQEVTGLRLVYLAVIFPNIGKIIHV